MWPASAADVPDDIERVTTTGSRFAQPSGSQPVVISDVNSAELALTSPVHIEQVLKYIAGAGVQRGNGQEYLPALRSQVFTGAGACGGLLTAEDGIPLRAAGFCNINELFEAHTEMAQRVEVLKGPGSPLYGSNAVHGVINVITPDTTQDAGLLGVDYGSYGYTRAKFRQGKDFGRSGVGINASVTRNSGYREEESVHQEKVNLRHRFDGQQISLTSGLTYTNLDQETAGYITGFESYKDSAIASSNENPEAFRKNRSLRVWTNAEWALGEDRRVSVTPYVRDQDMAFRMHFLPGTPLEENAQRGMGIQSLYEQSLSETWGLSMGVDAEYTDGSLTQFQDTPTQGSDFLQATVPEGQHYDYDVEATLWAPFASLRWQHEAWQVTAGARYETMHYDYTNNMLAGRTRDDGSTCGFGGCRYSRPPSGTDTYHNLSPKFGVSYQLSAHTQLYANLSRGYRAPQATELYRLQRDQQVAELDSETATNAEFGVKGRVQAFTYTLSAYHMRKDNVIFRDSDFFNVSDGESRHRGIEIELDYRFSTQWDLALAASHARHTYAHDQLSGGVNINGNDIDTAPRNLVNARLGWNPLPDTRVVLEWQHMDDYYTDPENQHSYAGHDLLHVRASASLTDGLTAYVRVLNLTDEAYAERADFSGFSGDRYFPGLPRHGMVSLEYRW
ncbi:TonB-dependent receptor [Alteromonas sp. ASW11-19]|uniref:TonB-dependent receptor n=1 Tax=Alteromonas salexigens TaxID=2982530 RepID=A0ABT2VJL5_9ALTE|nr:TonB-dependent receptor [Alteromonas salexigens]MCU7553432.1 TonB-dependent receptor [Alteromonas salexigens]